MSDNALVSFDMTAMQDMAVKIKALKGFMDENLEKGIDWENTHEVFRRELKEGEQAKPMLLDPGCAKIMNFMGVRPRHRVLEMQIDVESGNLRYVVAAEIVPWLPVMYRSPDKVELIYPVIAEGMGSATTREKRYRVKWEWFTERTLKVDGYTDADLADYRGKYPDRHREGKPNNLYYMASSEALGLDNTLIKMSSKRAEMDAVFQLPGVAGRYSQEVDLLEAQTGDRLPKPAAEPEPPKPPAEKPAEAPTEDSALLLDMAAEYPEVGRDALLAEAHAMMEKSSGLYTTLDAALSVLRRRLRKQNIGAGPAPPPPAPEKPTPKPEPKPEAEPKGEELTAKDGTALGVLSVEGDDLVFTPAGEFSVETPPFQSFLVDRVLEGMVTADQKRVEAGEIKEPFWYMVKEDNYRVVSVETHRVGGDRRLKEIASSLRWTFEKMLDKQREEKPDPGFKRATGETVMSPEEVRARAAVEGLTGSDQLTYKAEGDVLKISVKRFLADAWNPLNDALKGAGASWVSVKPTHWEVPLKKPEPTTLDVKPPSSLTVETVEQYLTGRHGDLALQRLAVTENSAFVMVEPYQKLTPEEQTGFGRSLKALGAEVKGDATGWFLKKPKGGKQ